MVGVHFVGNVRLIWRKYLRKKEETIDQKRGEATGLGYYRELVALQILESSGGLYVKKIFIYNIYAFQWGFKDRFVTLGNKEKISLLK